MQWREKRCSLARQFWKMLPKKKIEFVEYKPKLWLMKLRELIKQLKPQMTLQYRLEGRGNLQKRHNGWQGHQFRKTNIKDFH